MIWATGTRASSVAGYNFFSNCSRVLILPQNISTYVLLRVTVQTFFSLSSALHSLNIAFPFWSIYLCLIPTQDFLPFLNQNFSLTLQEFLKILISLKLHTFGIPSVQLTFLILLHPLRFNSITFLASLLIHFHS